ncbi:sodium/calcium exchanger regulatory protein 1-like [Strongylocentrotus purpuratus]|uniref:Lipocalin/cytosolic fatty-acid binding domain-containing protein n=1 Tax=Strongylocentrotus purpuratus TaxID=7668 RepID=A0A7M7PQD9_STRPU|nr:sodium/calcium exchanger regulatory protein 1 [Strongylocentrotus purpuratus]XP_030854477.1 sodium/calcium exchanger regulatory protein 1-like [Strongylocentrotus purpuratus]|eukprot:XP_003731365.1 PREDICTED: cellular retinoic acid-binding protein 1-like [Strongylocentrotus purpuratus]
MAQLVGSWKLVRSESFEEYLKEMGVNTPMRKLATHMHPSCEIKRDGDSFSIKMNVPVITIHEQGFTIGVPFEDLLPNGLKQMTIARLEDENKIRFLEEEESDKPHVVVREVIGDEMIMTCSKGDVKCTRIFKRIEN